MRYLVISDIHGNLQAFETVLADAKGLYDKVWCLGDLVSIGSHPNECVDLLLTLDHLCVAGDSDWIVLGKSDPNYGEFDINDVFRPKARTAYLQTREQLAARARDYLNNLPVILVVEDDFTLVHGSPRHPVWEYLLSPSIAQPSFAYLNTQYCLNGHSRVPVIFQEAVKRDMMCEVLGPDIDIDGIKDMTITFQLAERRLMINPGSVGGGIRLINGQFSFYIILDVERKSFEYKQIPLKFNPFRPLG
jgi:predicted phosphodiesterase